MTELARVRAGLQWSNGGPGVTTWYFSPGVPPVQWTDAGLVDVLDEVLAFYTDFKPFLAAEVQVTVDPVVDIVQVDNGNMVNQIVVSGATRTVQGAGVAAHGNRASQLCVNLLTDKFAKGRRLRGRHYHGPLADRSIDGNGFIESLAYDFPQDGYTAMVSGIGTRLAVYSRPSSKGASDGSYGDVTALRVMERPAILRSRRD